MSTRPAPPGPNLSPRWVEWPQAWRVIASRYPVIDLFERVSPDPAVWDVLIELEQLTNPRARDEVGAISLVPSARRVRGPNASWVMAAFTHLNPKGSRFSDGSYGVYYAADRLRTAIKETAYHFERIARDSNDPARREDMRVLVGSVANEFHDVGTLSAAQRSAVLDPDSYAASQPLARALRAAGSNGLVYPSVRDPEGQCIAAFWPDVVGLPTQERHLKYDWDGNQVVRYFDYFLNEWLPFDN
jgi:hypothetical protein